MMPLMVSVVMTPRFLVPVDAQRLSTIFWDRFWLEAIRELDRKELESEGAMVSAPYTEELSSPLA